jgi:hypothetical protein
MPTSINKNLSKVIFIIIGLFLLPGAGLSGCSEVAKLDPTITPTGILPTEVISLEIEELFERYTVVGIARDSFLSVHEKPSTDSLILGQIPSYGTDILPTGDIYQKGNTIWVFIGHQDTVGWVDLGFLGEQHSALPEDLIILGQQVLESLKNDQYGQLIPIIHPELCLRFSPYQYLNNESRIICPSEFDSYTSSTEPFAWGHYDGTGKPIDLTFIEYHQQFVYDQDYLKPRIVGFNVEVSSGNSLNNIQEIFPDGIMIEYYFPGIDPRYGGMDWRSLRLVFVPENDQWYLTAIIHGEWTI